MTVAPPRMAMNWTMFAALSAFIFTGIGMIVAASFYLAPLRQLPDDVKSLQADTTQTKVKMETLNGTLLALNVTVQGLSDSIKDGRALRIDYDQFKVRIASELEDIRRQLQERR